MVLDFSIFLLFMVSFLEHLLHNQDSSGGLNHLMIGSSFKQQVKKKLLKYVKRRRRTMSTKKKKCYGSIQRDCSLTLLPGYWEQRKSWNDMFNDSRTPTVDEVYNWLSSKVTGASKFRNIGPLTALLICGDLIEADIITPTPSSYKLGQLIYKVRKGAKDGMQMLGLVREGVDRNNFCNAFASLDAYIENGLGAEDKKAMGYNAVMLEHALCKIKRLTTNGFSLEAIFAEI